MLRPAVVIEPHDLASAALARRRHWRRPSTLGDALRTLSVTTDSEYEDDAVEFARAFETARTSLHVERSVPMGTVRRGGRDRPGDRSSRLLAGREDAACG